MSPRWAASKYAAGNEVLPRLLPQRCRRCFLGIDDDQDGNCNVCAGLDDEQARKIKQGVKKL